jgi:hypothetical protein
MMRDAYAYNSVVRVAKIGVYFNEEWKMQYHNSFIIDLEALHILYVTITT